MNKVAVYGSLRQGLGNHRLLASSKFLGEDISQPEWKMYSLGGFPGIVKGNSEVTLEVYEVDKDTFESLDWLEGYPTFYNRRVINTTYGDAWVYYLNEPDNYENHGVVETGDWKDYLTNRYNYDNED